MFVGLRFKDSRTWTQQILLWTQRWIFTRFALFVVAWFCYLFWVFSEPLTRWRRSSHAAWAYLFCPLGSLVGCAAAALFAVAAARLKCARQRNYLMHVSPFCQDFYLHCVTCVCPSLRLCLSLPAVCVCASVCVSVACLKQIACWLHICVCPLLKYLAWATRSHYTICSSWKYNVYAALICMCMPSVCVQVCTPLTLDSVHDFDMGKLSAITINANDVCKAKCRVSALEFIYS